MLSFQVDITSDRTAMSIFERFPKEIREMIYELCLCVEDVLDPYPGPFNVYDAHVHKTCRPTVALLALNKDIRSQALPILFRKNTWDVSEEVIMVLRDDDEAEDEYGNTLWYHYGSYIQKGAVKYTYRAVAVYSTRRAIWDAHDEGVVLNTSNERMHWIHEQLRLELEESWACIQVAMTNCHNMKSLTINIDDLYCPFGCCRTNIVFNLFSQYIPALKPKVFVAIQGCRNDKERESILAWRTRYLAGEEKEDALANITIEAGAWAPGS